MSYFILSVPLQLPQELPCNAVASAYPQRTLTATPTGSSHSGTAYETCLAGQRNQDVNIHCR